MCGGQLNERALKLVRTLPSERKSDNRNFLGAVGSKPCPQRAQVEYPSALLFAISVSDVGHVGVLILM